jgi:hypothetical protein
MAARYLSTLVSFNLVIDLRGEKDPPSKMLGLAFLVWLPFFGVKLTVMTWGFWMLSCIYPYIVS